MNIAQERLNREHDIQSLIEMNRATRILIKNSFLARQRRILAYLRRYVITTEDIVNVAQETPKKKVAKSKSVSEMSDAEIAYSVDHMLLGFDV